MKQPRLKPVPRKELYLLLEDYFIISRQHEILVPALFRYDGASIPPFAWHATYTPFHPHVMAPALVHDWLYVNHQIRREEADLVFMDLLVRNGVNEKMAWVMYQAVDFGGGEHWNYSSDDKYELNRLFKMCKWRKNLHEYNFPMTVISQ